MIKYIKSSVVIMVIGFLCAMDFQWLQSGAAAHILSAGFTALILAVLEISLSFDNAVVNATIIKKMDVVWKRRFLTWGILTAVFGMRLFFPLLIVAIVAQMNPIDAFILSMNEPARYAEIMISSHLTVSAFGGMFLLMVFLNFFMDKDKSKHWILAIEKPLAALAKIKWLDRILPFLVLLLMTWFISPENRVHFFVPGLWGIVIYLVVHGFSLWLESMEQDMLKKVPQKQGWLSAGLGLFLYLEILDASFSFDGVIGAFAITQSLIQIMIGLSIGAFFVRSITLYLVEKETLSHIRFLEHGAFYALGALALMMLLDYFFHFPEWVTGLTGAIILGASILWSIYVDRYERARQN